MAVAKKNAFSRDDIRVADFAKAISHPARIQILRYLAKNKSSSCGELVDFLPLSQSTVSQHLLELKKVGLIRANQTGPQMNYYIDLSEGIRAFSSLNDFFNCIVYRK